MNVIPKLMNFASSTMLKVNVRRVERVKMEMWMDVNGKITWKMGYLPVVPIILVLEKNNLNKNRKKVKKKRDHW